MHRKGRVRREHGHQEFLKLETCKFFLKLKRASSREGFPTSMRDLIRLARLLRTEWRRNRWQQTKWREPELN